MKKTTVFFLVLISTVKIFAYDDIPFQSNVGQWGAYARDGSIYINELGTPEDLPITSGHSDMKPSWSTEGDIIVFFRVIEFHSAVADWRTAICTIHTDGTEFHQWTSGEFADFNPTWTRDGTNRIVFSRYDSEKKKSSIILIDPANGEERIVSNPRRSEGVLTCLRDGRMLVTSNRFIFTGIYYLLDPDTGEYDRVKFDFRLGGFMDRCSFSPSENLITYEYKPGWKSFQYLDKTIYMAEWDRETLTVHNPRAISPNYENSMTLYPRFTKDESAIVYHSNFSGQHQLYYYSIEEHSTFRVSENRYSNYEFFCGEDSPK